MTKKVTPTKVTAGGGFNFEEKVIAYYSTFLLNNNYAFAKEDGLIERIDMQVRVDGWLLDDILITLKNSQGLKRICFSIKSNQQFIGCKAPKEFVNTAWEQFLTDTKTKFEKGKDGIGLVISNLPNNVHLAIQGLLNFSRTMPAEMLPYRLQEQGFTNDCVRELFYSFRCPKELVEKYNITDENIGELLKFIYIIEFDFDETISRKHDEIISLLTKILKSNSKDDAELLWSKLIQIVTETKRSGYINHEVLLGKLVGKFQLLEYPSHQSDWTILKSHTIENLESINDKIGLDVIISRDKDIKDLSETELQNSLTFLTGESGTGKTVLAKHWSMPKIEKDETVVWLDAEYLNRGLLNDFQNSLRLTHSLNEILAKCTSSNPVLIIDKLDRIYEDHAFRNISIILNKLLIQSPETSWHILIIVQSDELNRVISKLLNNNLPLTNYKNHEIGNPSITQYKELLQKHTAIYKFIIRNKSNSLLLKPKILDIIAQNASILKGINNNGSVSESEIIDWIWDNHIRKGDNSEERASFVMRLAEMQALSGKIQVPKSDFAIQEQSPLNSLVRDKICIVKDEKISFTHNLFSDWSLYRLLVSNDQNINTYLQDKKDSPAWIRSLRLYFIRLIDKESNLYKWLSQYNNFAGDNLLQDIMLDSILFATNTLPILEKLWTDFLSKYSDVFRRLLKRFLYITTTPDPWYMLLFKNDKSFSESELATFKRVPNYIYWTAVLKFLHNHFDAVVKMSLFDMAQISDLWLRNTEPKYVMRKEAAEFGIYAAEHMLAQRISPHPLLGGEKMEEIAYRAGLAAINEFPDRVINLALIASRKKKPDGKIKDGIDAIEKEYNEITGKTVQKPKRSKKDFPPGLFSPSIFSQTKKSKPWKEGPYKHPVSEFSKVCLTTDALHPVIISNPTKAIEIIMCLLIEVKEIKKYFDRYEVKFEDCGMRKIYEWYPPFYTNGSFSSFLNNDFESGIELIIKLTEFATNRWRDNASEAGYKNGGVTLNFYKKRKKFYGDATVFYWHRQSNNAPFSVTTALMALEKWLYDHAEDTNKIKKAVEIIYKTSTSLALIGVLSTFGKKNNRYFEDILFPIISTPEFHYWDLYFVVQGENHQMIGWSFRKGEFLIKLAQDWNSMSHRKIELNTYFSWLIINSKNFQEKLPFLKKEFVKRFSHYKSDSGTRFSNYLEKLIAECNLANWVPIETNNKNEIIYELRLPQHLTENNKKDEQQANDNMLLLTFPFKCKQILDGEILLSENEVNDFYDNIEKFKSQIKPNIDESLMSVADSICGIIAVLYKFHEKWLKKNPDAEQKCLTYITELFNNPPKTDAYFTEVSIFDAHWYSFCGYFLPTIWSKNPDSKEIRHLISILASIPHYITTSILLENVWKLRKELNDNFYQLLHFILNLSYLRANYYRLHDETFPAALDIEIEKFNNKKLSAQIPLLLDIGKQFSPIAGERMLYRGVVHLDLALIRNAFSFLSIIDVSNDEEKQLAISIMDNISAYTLATIEKQKDKDYNYPNDWEHWVFDIVSFFILRINDEAISQKYWMPIMSLGSSANHYLSAFLHSFFAAGLNERFIDESFRKTWYQILDFSFESEYLKYSTGKSSYDLDDIWCALIGIDDQSYTEWGEKHTEFLASSFTYFEKWGRNQLSRAKCMFRCLKLMLKLPADKFSFDILMLVNNSIKSIKDNYKDEQHINSELSSVLHHLWDKNKEYIKNNKDVYNCFNDLVLYLNEKQYIGALELIERMSAN